MTIPDITIENHGGTIVLVRPQTAEALEWLEENTNGQWFAHALVVEARCVDGLVNGLEDAGLKVTLEVSQ